MREKLTRMELDVLDILVNGRTVWSDTGEPIAWGAALDLSALKERVESGTNLPPAIRQRADWRVHSTVLACRAHTRSRPRNGARNDPSDFRHVRGRWVRPCPKSRARYCDRCTGGQDGSSHRGVSRRTPQTELCRRPPRHPGVSQ